MIEILNEDAPWPIDLPREDVYIGRLLVADIGGDEFYSWLHDGTCWREQRAGHRWEWTGILASVCTGDSWSLRSLPAPTEETP